MKGSFDWQQVAKQLSLSCSLLNVGAVLDREKEKDKKLEVVNNCCHKTLHFRYWVALDPPLYADIINNYLQVLHVPKNLTL